jgi:hypothetical protein
MSNDEVRRIAAIVRREMRQDVRIVIDGVMRVEASLREMNARVGHLENDKIVREARENERDRQAKQAAELVATKAADAISERQWSVKKWTTIVSAVAVAFGSMTTLTSVLGQWLAHNPPPGP